MGVDGEGLAQSIVLFSELFVWHSVSELIGVMPGLQELSGVSQQLAGFSRLTTFNSSPMKWLKRRGTSCDRHKLMPSTPLNPETLRQIALKHCERYVNGILPDGAG
jgi:hypothetical protein